jgi:hypothetical protein
MCSATTALIEGDTPLGAQKAYEKFGRFTALSDDTQHGTRCDSTGHFVATLDDTFLGKLEPGTATINVFSFSTGDFVTETVRLTPSHSH